MRAHRQAIVARPADASWPRRPGAGSPAESAPTFGITRGRRSSPERRRRAARETRASWSRSAVSPSQRIAAPPTRTSGRHHSAATGGCASAFAVATSQASSGCSSARPQTTLHVRRRPAAQEVALAPLGVEQRHLALGSAAASGIPGEPPPEPTSTTGPSYCATQGTRAQARRAASRRASARSRERRQARRREDRARASAHVRERRRRSGSAPCPR